MNAVLILTRNCLELTKRCVESVRNQDVPTYRLFVDNGSSDGTKEWIRQQTGDGVVDWSENRGVSRGWNEGISHLFRFLFDHKPVDHILVIGNDTVLAPWTYSALLSANVPFVTGVDVGMSPLPDKPDVFPLSPHPDFSCFLIRRECWEKVGPFDERMVNYVGDCDYHVRAHRLGIPLYKANIPYNHERSSTMKRASAEDRAEIEAQANADRKVFDDLYGCQPGSPEYSALFK